MFECFEAEGAPCRACGEDVHVFGSEAREDDDGDSEGLGERSGVRK